MKRILDWFSRAIGELEVVRLEHARAFYRDAIFQCVVWAICTIASVAVGLIYWSTLLVVVGGVMAVITTLFSYHYVRGFLRLEKRFRAWST